MVAILKTCLLVPLLLWGLLLPKVGAIILDLHPGVELAVICTGTEMITLRVGPDGSPVKSDTFEDAPCVLADPSTIIYTGPTAWIELAREFQARFVAVPNTLARHHAGLLVRESQGPPLA